MDIVVLATSLSDQLRLRLVLNVRRSSTETAQRTGLQQRARVLESCVFCGLLSNALSNPFSHLAV